MPGKLPPLPGRLPTVRSLKQGPLPPLGKKTVVDAQTPGTDASSPSLTGMPDGSGSPVSTYSGHGARPIEGEFPDSLEELKSKALSKEKYSKIPENPTSVYRPPEGSPTTPDNPSVISGSPITIDLESERRGKPTSSDTLPLSSLPVRGTPWDGPTVKWDPYQIPDRKLILNDAIIKGNNDLANLLKKNEALIPFIKSLLELNDAQYAELKESYKSYINTATDAVDIANFINVLGIQFDEMKLIEDISKVCVVIDNMTFNNDRDKADFVKRVKEIMPKLESGEDIHLPKGIEFTEEKLKEIKKSITGYKDNTQQPSEEDVSTVQNRGP